MAKSNSNSNSEHGGTEITPSTLFSYKYKKGEDRMTMALLQVIQAGGIDLLWHIGKSLEMTLPDSYIRIMTQKGHNTKEKDAEKSILDGFISLHPFELIIESKINNNPINIPQLNKYSEIIDKKRSEGIDAYLLYITSDPNDRNKLKDYSDTVYCITWEEILKILEEYPGQSPQLTNMLQGLTGLYAEINHIPLSIPADRVVTILAGRFAYDRAKEEGIYNCQGGRKFRSTKYFAFYANREIAKVFRIKGRPFENGGRYPNLPATDDIYLLEPIDDIILTPITNDDYNTKGHLRPLTMGMPRYVDLNTLSQVKTIKELKKRNNLK